MKGEIPMSARFRLFVVVACLLLVPALAQAQGHLLHGTGPINSSMGGAGTALLEDSVAALTFNPALIAGVKGNQLSFTTEFFRDSIQIDTTLALPGNPSGTATATKSTVVYPAFGWMSRHPEKKLALGFGLIGIGGFRADYPQDTASILFAPPPAGFGRIFTDYRLTKIPIAMAYQVTPKLALGASFNVYYAEFAVAPLPYEFYDQNAQGQRFYPSAGNMNGRFALGGQFGFVYQVTPKATIGASLTTAQDFSTYEWNSTNADPGSPDYGKHRTVSYSLGGPMIISFGTGMKLGSKTELAVDGMFTKFTGVDGLGSAGGIVNGVIQPFGWRDTWTFKVGVRHQATEKLNVRLGYNYSQTPLRSEVILTGTGAPVTYQNHFCGGLGLKMFPFLTAEAAFYYVPREHVTGPLPIAQGVNIGTLDTSNQITSAVIGLNFTF
jgi:long-chain fatty acid transport protein